MKTQRVKKLEELGKKLKSEFIFQNKTAKILIEEENAGYFEGYSENYIKCYIKGDFKVGDIVNVKIDGTFKDGAIATKVD